MTSLGSQLAVISLLWSYCSVWDVLSTQWDSGCPQTGGVILHLMLTGCMLQISTLVTCTCTEWWTILMTVCSLMGLRSPSTKSGSCSCSFCQEAAIHACTSQLAWAERGFPLHEVWRHYTGPPTLNISTHVVVVPVRFSVPWGNGGKHSSFIIPYYCEFTDTSNIR